MPSKPTLPGTDAGAEREAIICHVDMDCFYAACERLREPALIGEAVVVGMGYEAGDDGGVVATASYEAREHGIASAQPIADALAALPRASVMPADYTGPVGHYRPVDMAYYKEVSEAVLDVLSTFTDTIRVASPDEAYLDVSDATSWSDARSLGASIKARIDDEVGVPASVGIAPTVAVAKIASDVDKPDGLTVVPPDTIDEFLEDLPVEALHGVGPVTAESLHDMGLSTIGDVARAPPTDLIDRFGDRGRDLSRRARGEGSAEVTPRGRPKSLSRETSLGGPTEEYDRLQSAVRSLASAVAERAERKGAQYRTVGIKVVTPPFEVRTRERSFPGPFSDADLLEETAVDLLREFESTPIRKVGVRVSNLDFAADQVSLDDWSTEHTSDFEPESALSTGRQGRLSDFPGRSDR